jgi:hypothetical protein
MSSGELVWRSSRKALLPRADEYQAINRIPQQKGCLKKGEVKTY